MLSPPRDSVTVRLKITVAFDERLGFKPVLLKLDHVPIEDSIKRDMSASVWWAHS